MAIIDEKYTRIYLPEVIEESKKNTASSFITTMPAFTQHVFITPKAVEAFLKRAVKVPPLELKDVSRICSNAFKNV